MKASVGDRIVMASSVVDGPVRAGRVVALRHDDGSPPYVVRWSDTDEESLVFPGPDTHVEHHHPGEHVGADAAPRTLGSWQVQVSLTHDGGETTAHAVLVGSGPAAGFAATGEAHRNPADPDAPGVGEEIAVARALRHLADRLVDRAEVEISAATGEDAEVELD